MFKQYPGKYWCILQGQCYLKSVISPSHFKRRSQIWWINLITRRRDLLKLIFKATWIKVSHLLWTAALFQQTSPSRRQQTFLWFFLSVENKAPLLLHDCATCASTLDYTILLSLILSNQTSHPDTIEGCWHECSRGCQRVRSSSVTSFVCC